MTHEDCAGFATDFGTLLDVEELVPGTAEYTLEVSSPGVERKLLRPSDWERFQGFLVTAKLFTALNGAKVLVGRMTLAGDVSRSTFLPSSRRVNGNRDPLPRLKRWRFPYATLKKPAWWLRSRHVQGDTKRHNN